jgi:hypothetical protein
VGWFKKSKNNFNNQFNKDISIILNAIDRRKGLLLSDNFIDNDVANIETEKFVIKLYENGVLKVLGDCNFENKDGYYNTNEEGKVLVKDIIFRILNDNDLKKLEDDILFIHNYLSLIINK